MSELTQGVSCTAQELHCTTGADKVDHSSVFVFTILLI